MRIEDDYESWRLSSGGVILFAFCCCSAVTVGTPFIRGQIQLLLTRTLAYHVATSSLFDWPIDAQRVNSVISFAYHQQVPSNFSSRLPPKDHDSNLVQYLNNTNTKPRRHVSQTLAIPKCGRDPNEDRNEEKERYHLSETGFSLHVFPSFLSSQPRAQKKMSRLSNRSFRRHPHTFSPKV